jgi:hypothetical protein
MASGEANVVENHDDAVAVELPAPQGWKKMVRSLFFFCLFGFRFEFLFLARFRDLIRFLWLLYSNLRVFFCPCFCAAFSVSFRICFVGVVFLKFRSEIVRYTVGFYASCCSFGILVCALSF